MVMIPLYPSEIDGWRGKWNLFEVGLRSCTCRARAAYLIFWRVTAEGTGVEEGKLDETCTVEELDDL